MIGKDNLSCGKQESVLICRIGKAKIILSQIWNIVEE